MAMRVDEVFMMAARPSTAAFCTVRVRVRVCMLAPAALLKAKEQRELHLQLLSTSGKLLSAQL